MADMRYSVEITGPALSFLYFAAVSSPSVTDGFLFGSVEEQQIEFISDSNESGIKQRTIIRVSGVFPLGGCNSIKPWYSDDGTPDWEQIKLSLPKKDMPNKIVGWFSCRNNSQFKPSFRETAIHSHLISKLNQKKFHNFLFVLVQNMVNMNAMSREFHSKYFHLTGDHKRKWSVLTGKVLNWNPKSSGSDKSPYRSLPTLEPDLLAQCAEEPKRLGLTGSDLVERIIKNTHAHMGKSLQRIVKLQSEIERVEAEIAQLKENPRAKCELQDADGDGDGDGDELLAGDSFHDEHPTSPPIGIRRPNRLVNDFSFVSGSSSLSNQNKSSTKVAQEIPKEARRPGEKDTKGTSDGPAKGSKKPSSPEY